ncbi:MAG: AAA family ATPase [Verrucomicrobiota bacterium]
MKVLSLYHIKGGVGKTTSAVNLAYAAATEGFSVLLCDLDPQAASTFYLRAKPPTKMKTGKLIKGKSFAHKQVRQTEFIHLDLLPAHLEFRHLDRTLDEEKKSSTALSALFKGFKGDYDLIVADAPAGISLLSENLFRLSHLVLVPTIPSTLSVHTFDQVKGFFEKNNLPVNRLKAFFSMADQRKKLHRETMEESREGSPHFLAQTIPSASIIEQMGTHRRPVAAFARTSPAAASFQSLWSEVRTELGLD